MAFFRYTQCLSVRDLEGFGLIEFRLYLGLKRCSIKAAMCWAAVVVLLNTVIISGNVKTEESATGKIDSVGDSLIESELRLKVKLGGRVLSIREIQGDSLNSPFAGQVIVTRGVVTGAVRRGFFIQTPNKIWDGVGSDAIFVYSPDLKAVVGTEVEVTGECINYLKDDDAKPITQIHLESLNTIDIKSGGIEAIELRADKVDLPNGELASYLNSLEGMMVSIPPGSTFIAPSNKFGDYVVALEKQFNEEGVVTTEHNGVIVESSNPLRWFPGFRVTHYRYSQRLNVGSKLRSRIAGPLNYRVESYQIAVSHDFDVEPCVIDIKKSSIKPSNGALTVMTLNCFNLDPHLESAKHVTNPRQDVDDDWGEGRFHSLAHAVASQSNLPDIVALQEIQDNDGAELTEVTDASQTYELLIKTIEQLSGKKYQWIDVKPVLGEDGGQPGGNIRNGYLYNPDRVTLLDKSIKILGKNEACFESSRKPLVTAFVEKYSQKQLTVINVHLASKRHQSSIFSPVNPGVDGKLDVRSQQAAVIQRETSALDKLGMDYYVTGDFNDGENSQPLKALLGDESANLVFTLTEHERYDYNHRGKLQVLMHGIVSKSMLEQGRAEYEIIHGNELIGVEPNVNSDKPSDHAYVIAKLHL